MIIKKTLLLSCVMMLLSACSNESADSKGQFKHRSQFSNETLVAGRALYQKNCAECHGADAAGSNTWRQRDANGKFPPPPLNGTGHTWHHPSALLKEIIFNGTAQSGGNMPAWRDKLTTQEVDAILSWLQTLWPQQSYDAWRDIERQNVQ